MELSKQVCSLEQAKKLKELGVEQKSLFYHYLVILNGIKEFKTIPVLFEHYGELEVTECIARAISGESKNEFYAAFTVAELGVMLHNYNSTYLPILDSKFKTEAEYRADRLIACIPELITVEEVNARLTFAGVY